MKTILISLFFITPLLTKAQKLEYWKPLVTILASVNGTTFSHIVGQGDFLWSAQTGPEIGISILDKYQITLFQYVDVINGNRSLLGINTNKVMNPDNNALQVSVGTKWSLFKNLELSVTPHIQTNWILNDYSALGLSVGVTGFALPLVEFKVILGNYRPYRQYPSINK